MLKYGLGDVVRVRVKTETKVIETVDSRVTIENFATKDVEITCIFPYDNGVYQFQAVGIYEFAASDIVSVVKSLPFKIGSSVLASVYNENVKNSKPRRGIVLKYHDENTVLIRFANDIPMLVAIDCIETQSSNIEEAYRYGKGASVNNLTRRRPVRCAKADDYFDYYKGKYSIAAFFMQYDRLEFQLYDHNNNLYDNGCCMSDIY